MMRKIIYTVAGLFTLLPLHAQKSYDDQVKDYIAKYKDLAVAEQLRCGIPASITLAQGIYETAAGSSELCTQAANHFGIKCKNNWTGATYAYTDDARDECFRKYESDDASYRDHSDFLKNNPRYSTLFRLNPMDYEDWAKGLKKCGYATNPQYALKIIQTIENYHLQEYTALAMKAAGRRNGIALAENDPGPAFPAPPGTGNGNAGGAYANQIALQAGSGEPADSSAQAPDTVSYYETTSKNGLKGFYARKGDLLLEYAINHHIRYGKLLSWNDLPDAPLESDMFIYLTNKRNRGADATYTVKRGMDLLQISQETGVQLDALRSLNHLKPGEEPVAGTVLHLQDPLESKPDIYEPEPVAVAAPARSARKAPDGDYVRIDHHKRKSKKAADAEDDHMTPVAAAPVTPLERLKAHMDKVVYGREHAAAAEASVTLPARKQAAAQPAYPESPDAGERSPHLPPASSRFYTVKPGDTAFSIAKKHNITLAELKEWNHLPQSMVVQKGMKLRVAK